MSVILDVPSAEAEADRPQPSAPTPGRLTSLRRFWPYLRPYRFELTAATALSVAAMLTAVFTPLVIARIVDGPIARGDLSGIVAPVLAVLALGVIEAVGVWGRRWLLAKPATQFEITMRAKIFRELQALAIGRHDSWESGQLLSRAVDDLATVRRFIGFAGPVLVIHAVVIPVGLAVLVAMSWQIGLIFAAAALPLTIICTRFVRRYGVASRRSQDQSGDLATTAEESAQGIRVLKAFGRGSYFGGHFTAQARELQRTEMYKVRLDATLWSAMVVLSESILVFALGFGAYAVVSGTMTLGAVVGAITLATFLQWPIIWTGFLLAELNDAGTAADRYWEIIDTPTDITDPADPVSLPERVIGELRLDGVRFAFPEAEDDVLRDISLTVRPGETVALVGATGSGKTALLNLIPRLYDVTGGAVTIDGIDIAALRVRDLRSLVSVAFEDPVLFSASVRENVALGDPDASDADVRRALEIAQAMDFVENLPWGLDTRIGEQGLSLSGGQRQRLALARAVLTRAGREGRARIVVLDDPLSALDVQTEEKVQERLRTALAGATTLLVAHRPSTAALADRVALLADGRIVAEGTHDQLLRTSSRYRELMGGES
ncbi:ABC transporter ATP-binding protein [Nocardia cyriacigeorgica]|uniref:ABC transporter ATP-binding protein n=1 Tax=Nocardia cyriacigeorgica TaxID=135487 RepID=A0A6P1DBR7_9NOCA|nr:ABC transporter ATP-binding protein [Nocardia cyriacigeorgica]NEW38182.1 ABC transporter ATP-binding protein [Nocardia cyriacigeorgica]NEW47021.1 ABC transporter ATP-binding protein [Nocardia cyriacigeorgica]NEW52627.1 ABC transporter ATP-binding protein [Nocardia cyriacigeorgica]NEW57671.1 ABC transporter ATP-binding protein [Nocardia cyriacigeorgica]